MTYPPPPPNLRNLDNFSPGAKKVLYQIQQQIYKFLLRILFLIDFKLNTEVIID